MATGDGFSMSDYLELPFVTITLFIPAGDLADAECRLRALRGGDKRSDVAAAIAVAAGYARGYRIEYSEANGQHATPPPVAVRRSPFEKWRE